MKPSLVPLICSLSSMGWNDTWNDILQGGSKRWKVDDVEKKAIALNYITEHATSDEKSLAIFCPLVGDDFFVHYAWSQGHSVTGADLVPAALKSMRGQFKGEWTSEEYADKKVWTHDSGRVVLYETDILVRRPELEAKFDAIYDKDAFGALDYEMRKPFCNRIGSYLKDGGIVYTEVKLAPGKVGGPPFSVTKEDLMESFGSSTIEYVASLGKVYDIAFPGAGTSMTQTGHILRRLKR
jgi:hypothetical protein